MPAENTVMADAQLEEDTREFGRRFARFVVSRGFRKSDGAVEGSANARISEISRSLSGELGGRGNVRSALEKPASDAEAGLRASQRLAQQLQADADAMRFRVLPSLRENARQLQALFVAIDRVSDEVMPGIEEAIARMEKAMHQMEERRKEQVETRSFSGSYGLGSPWGAGLWVPPSGDNTVSLPHVYETNKVFHVEEGGLAPL